MFSIKSQWTYFVLVILTIILGLLSRTSYIPELIYPYLGDFFYALMYYWICALLFPRLKPIYLLYLSIGICFLIECSQLYQADWINNIRYTRMGGLILGFGFLWSDLFSYCLGGILGFTIDKQIKLR